MASTFIPVRLNDDNARFARDLKQASTLTRQLFDLLDALVLRGFRYLGDDPQNLDFAAFEAAHGLEAGSGETVFNILNGTRSAMTGTAQSDQAIELRDRIG